MWENFGDDESEDLEASIASRDYPVLSEILVERPPLPHAYPVTASRRTEESVTPVEILRSQAVERDISAEAGIWTDLAKAIIDPPPLTYNAPSFDWCRFRKDQRCMFPQHLNQEATKIAGYEVWHVEDRGFCPRDKWKEQEVCPISEPGPNSGSPKALIECTSNWEDGGQRDGVPGPFRHGRYAALTWTECPVCDGLGEVTVKNWLAGPSQVTCGTCQGRGLLRNYYTDPAVFDPTTVEVAAALRTAAWSDVRAKAATIRREGGVKVIAVTDTAITAEVKGHSAVYQTTLHREPGTRRVSLWECSCPWAAYSWDRSGRWKRFEGRMCAHALALAYEAQSQEFGGGTLAEDPDSWSAQGEKPTFYEAPPKPENWQVAAAVESKQCRYCGQPIEGEAEKRKTAKGRVEWQHPDAPEGCPAPHQAARNSPFPVEIDPEMGLVYLNGQTVIKYPTYHPTLGLTASRSTLVLQVAQGHDVGEVADRAQAMVRSNGGHTAAIVQESTDGRVVIASQEDLGAWWAADGNDRLRGIPGVESLRFEASVPHLAEIDPADPEAGMREVEEICAKGDHTHSGLVIKAVDSGRVLLTQRTPYSEDPEGVYGRWEFPGGSIGEDEAPFESAMREFREETGLELPEGWRVTGCYESGPYIAVIVLVPSEAWTTNGEMLDFETMGIGWFHPDQIEGTDLVREEMESADWEMIREAAKTAAHGIVLEQSPLDYHGVRPKRLAIRVPGEWDPKMPRGDEASASYFTPPHSATPEGDDTVAFLDFSEQADSIYIHFMAVRPDFEGKGLARLLVEHLYAMTDKDIDWGRVMSDRAEALWRSIRDAHPDRWNRARLSSVHEAARKPIIEYVGGSTSADDRQVTATPTENGYDVVVTTYGGDVLATGSIWRDRQRTMRTEWVLTLGDKETEHPTLGGAMSAAGKATQGKTAVLAAEQVSEYPAVMGGFYEVYDDEDPGFQEAQEVEAILHDEPEPALPVAEGAEEDDEVEQRRRMLEGSSGITDADIAKAAKQHLAAAVFSPKEQMELIEEGDGEVVAANLDRLQIEGTHYEALDARLQSADDLFW